MRSVNKVAAHRRRKRTLKLAKGYWGRKKNVWTVAKNQIERGLMQAYVGRKLRKRDFRALWVQRINAAARQNGLNYSQLIHLMKVAQIDLNRKVLADLALNHPEAFTAVVNAAQAQARQAA